MFPWKKIVFLMVPVFILVSLFVTTSFANGKKHGKGKRGKSEVQRGARDNANRGDWRDEIRYSQGHHRSDCNLPPGLAKKGKVPHGWEKKCRQQPVKHRRNHHEERHQEHYPVHDTNQTTGRNDKPSGELDIGLGIRIPLP